MPAKRLQTAFDSVTLYGNDPDHRPDIYGKIGNAGVSICCLDDAKKAVFRIRFVQSNDFGSYDYQWSCAYAFRFLYECSH